MGSWAFAGLRLMARLKFLRGTILDPFRTEHRELERQLIRDYEATLGELTLSLSTENRGLAVEIASIPEQIRGFELVKEEQLKTAKEKEAQLLAEFRRLT